MSGEWPYVDSEWSRYMPDQKFRHATPYDHHPAGRCAPYHLTYNAGPPPVLYPPPPQQPYLPLTPPHLTSPPGLLSHNTLLSPPNLMTPPQMMSPPPQPYHYPSEQTVPRGENPREIRNKAEKQRRDKLNQSITELANMVPPVVAASRKIDKTGILRLTAHYLRSHQYVFGDAIDNSSHDIKASTVETFLRLMQGFLVTLTYKGIVVVISQNIQDYLGYSELDLLGQNIMSIIHEDDRRFMREHLMPKSCFLGPNGELLIPDEPDGKKKVEDALANDRRRFVIRFKKQTQRAETPKYITCHVDGSLRKSDRACRGYSRSYQIVRRARARGEMPCSSGNDIVFVGLVRPMIETFIKEREIESFRMQYRTRHSVDGEIIQCEQKISLITGYMMCEVQGVNAMNFMHRDDVRWVIIALREMYDKGHLFGDSCYRLMTKNGQFIHMKTQGRLEIEEDSKAVTTFVCTNTVVDETEGTQLIKLMKNKYNFLINNQKLNSEEDNKDHMNDNDPPVEDPKELEKVIMHLMESIPPANDTEDLKSSCDHENGPSTSPRVSIIPPRKERIVSAIGKMYDVMKSFSVFSPDRGNDSRMENKTETTTKPSDTAENVTSIQMTNTKSRTQSMTKLTSFEESFLMPNDKINDLTFLSDGTGPQLLENIGRPEQTMPMKRAGEQVVEDHAFKKKICENPLNSLENDDDLKIDDGFFENNCEDNMGNLLNNNGMEIDTTLNILQIIGNTADDSQALPVILLEPDFFSTIDCDTPLGEDEQNIN